MANGGGNIWPSATGGGLTAGTGAYLQALVQKKLFEQEQQKIDVSKRQVAVEEAAQKTNEQRQAMYDAAYAMQRLASIIPFVPEGTKLKDMPSLHPLFKQAVPELDPSDPTMGEWDVNPRTIDYFLNNIALSQLDEWERSGDPVLKSIGERMVSMATGGEGRSFELMQALEGTELENVGILANALENLKNDPEQLEDYARIITGRQPKTSFYDPWQDMVRTYDRELDAQLSARLIEAFNLSGLEWSMASGTQTKDMGEALVSQVSNVYGTEVQLGLPQAMRIMSALNAQVVGEQEGKYSSGEGPWYNLWEEYLSKGVEGEIPRRGMMLASNGLASANAIIQHGFYSNPGAVQSAWLNSQLDLVEGLAPGARSGRDRRKIIRSLAENMSQFGVELGGMGTKKFSFNAPTVHIPGYESGGMPGSAPNPIGGDVPLDLQMDTNSRMREAMLRLNMSPYEIEIVMDIERLRNKEVSFDELREKYRSDPRVLQQILKESKR